MSMNPRLSTDLRPLAGRTPLALSAAVTLGVTAGDPRPLLAILAGGESLTGDLSWQDRSRCAEVDPEIFFPERGGSVRAAKAVCRSCEVQNECLEYALARDERFGIYGGKSERERRRMKPAVRNGPGLCGKGLHVLTPDNIYAAPGGQKTWCRACRRIADEKRRLKEKYERETIEARQERDAA